MVRRWHEERGWYSWDSSIHIFEKEKFLRLTRTILKDKMAQRWSVDGMKKADDT